ncbi:MAG: Hsp20/alpha crystallin family protein [Flavobacteriales bacterium]|nr:Hsp20/alpha crystallin family protein [Flavobacteriales bacterium]
MTYTVSRRRPAFPSLFDDFFNNDLFNMGSGELMRRAASPAVNIKETEKDFQLEVSAPGMKKEDFKIELDNDMLTISAEVKNENSEQDDQGNYTRREFSYASFSRSFTMPEDRVKEEEIEANYTDGVLHITLPKMEEEEINEQKRLIEVK